VKRLLILFFIMINFQAFSGSCLLGPFNYKHFYEYGLIVKGDVLSVEDDENKYYRVLTIKIDTIYRQKFMNLQDSIVTFKCINKQYGYQFKKGEKAIVFLYDGDLETHWCSHNCAYDENSEVVKLLNQFGNKSELEYYNDYLLWLKENNFLEYEKQMKNHYYHKAKIEQRVNQYKTNTVR